MNPVTKSTTTQPTHTPGPWTAAECGVYSTHISSHGNFYVAALPFPNEEVTPTDKANLALIAAAPDLRYQLDESVAMIERLRGWIKALADDHKTPDRAADVLESSGALNESSRTLLLKVEGRA